MYTTTIIVVTIAMTIVVVVGVVSVVHIAMCVVHILTTMHIIHTIHTIHISIGHIMRIIQHMTCVCSTTKRTCILHTTTTTTSTTTNATIIHTCLCFAPQYLYVVTQLVNGGLVLGEGCFQLSPLRPLQLQVRRQLVDLLGLQGCSVLCCAGWTVGEHSLLYSDSLGV